MARTRKRILIVSGGAVVALLAGAASVTALSGNGSQALSPSSPGIKGAEEVGDFFAASVAIGDFDGDGYGDVIAGAPFEDIGSSSAAGMVHVLYGTASGVTGSGDATFHQGSPGIPGGVEAGDMFGMSLTTGDFNNDGYDDAAIGAHLENHGAKTDTGSVTVLYGTASGLTGVGSKAFSQGTAGVAGAVEPYDEFGYALAAGDFNDDGYDDLVVGSPGEGIGSRSAAGVVHVLFGSSSGITGSGSQSIHQDSAGVPGVAETNDWFGTSLAVGDFDDDGTDDLAVGAPGEALGSNAYTGSVHVFSGSSSGLKKSGSKAWTQKSAGIKGAAEAGDQFATSLVAGDFDGDGADDLAVGVPGEAIGTIPAAGAVNVIYGSSSGLTGAGDENWSQKNAGIRNSKQEAGDEFALAVAAGDFDDDGRDDLVIGVPGEGRGSVGGAGVVHVLYGSTTGTTTVGDDLWRPGNDGLSGAAHTNAGVGRSLATGDINNDGHDDLVIGVPGGEAGNLTSGGSLIVIYGVN